jgi:glycosyltransferase involved in cell wall biosynthesis
MPAGVPLEPADRITRSRLFAKPAARAGSTLARRDCKDALASRSSREGRTVWLRFSSRPAVAIRCCCGGGKQFAGGGSLDAGSADEGEERRLRNRTGCEDACPARILPRGRDLPLYYLFPLDVLRLPVPTSSARTAERPLHAQGAPARAAGGRRPKLVHVSTSDMSIGVLLLNQLLHYRDAGYDVVAVCSPGPYLERVEQAGIRVVTVPMIRAITPLADLKSLWGLVRVFRRERPDIVHTHTPKAGLLGQWAARLAGVPARVHTIHGLYFPSGMTPRTRPLFVGLERVTMAFSNLVLSQNPEDMPVVVAEKICSADRLRLLNNGIDLRRFDPAAVPDETVQALRREIGLLPEHRVVGMVGRVNVEKGYHELFRAAARIAAAVPEARFVVIGPVEAEKSNALDPRALAREHGVEDRLHYLGSRGDMPALYRLMDVLVLPSHREGWPRSPMEASAMGVPVVVTDIRGCRQVVVPGETGLMIPVRDADALADATIELLRDPARARRMGDAARAHAVRAFDENDPVRRTLQAYAELVPAGAAR